MNPKISQTTFFEDTTQEHIHISCGRFHILEAAEHYALSKESSDSMLVLRTTLPVLSGKTAPCTLFLSLEFHRAVASPHIQASDFICLHIYLLTPVCSLLSGRCFSKSVPRSLLCLLCGKHPPPTFLKNVFLNLEPITVAIS